MSILKLCPPTQSPIIFWEFERVVSADTDAINKTFEGWIWGGIDIYDITGSPNFNRGA